jgi:pimeloyl-ACP methyl ester carboxylesterase
MNPHLVRAGSRGTPVLLLHGIGGSSASFASQLPALARRHRALAWDAPGYGASADPAAAPGMDGYADAAAEVLATHGRGHVVGVSWGGVIGTALAVWRPELVASLTLADSSRGSGRTGAAAAAMLARAEQLAELGAPEFARRRASRLVGPHASVAARASVLATMSAVRLPGYRFAAESMAHTDHSALLAGLRVPTLVLVGEHDQVTGVPESRALAGSIPGARLVVIPHAGHAANQEQPAAFNRALLNFLADVETVVETGVETGVAANAGTGRTHDAHR